MALTTNDFILLRMVFNEKLRQAVLSKNEQEVVEILHNSYPEQMGDPVFVHPERIDVDFLYDEFLKEDKEEKINGSNYNWAL
ncbi:hypothetical protein ACFSR7_06015 [Cohnella sp. GCM10020058]|uniref:hypothetical protein n=1 Tax=Cohnella sp. GCM10020058 TaxID=3317330 RepID=UPI0036419209